MENSALAKIYFKTCICLSRDEKFVMGFNVRRTNSSVEYTVDLVSKDNLSKSTFKKSVDVKKVVQSEYLRRQLVAA